MLFQQEFAICSTRRTAKGYMIAVVFGCLNGDAELYGVSTPPAITALGRQGCNQGNYFFQNQLPHAVEDWRKCKEVSQRHPVG